MEDDQACEECSYSSASLVTAEEIAFLYSGKAEGIVDNLEARFLPVTEPWVPAVIETIDVALRSYLLSPTIEPQLTTWEEFHRAFRHLKLSKTPVPNGIP